MLTPASPPPIAPPPATWLLPLLLPLLRLLSRSHRWRSYTVIWTVIFSIIPVIRL